MAGRLVFCRNGRNQRLQGRQSRQFGPGIARLSIKLRPAAASIAPLGPYGLRIRRKLYASTCRLISVCTRGRVFVRKWVAPIQDFNVPNTCSTVLRRCRILPGLASRATLHRLQYGLMLPASDSALLFRGRAPRLDGALHARTQVSRCG